MRVEALHAPQPVRVLRTEILDSRALAGREDLEMGRFVDILLNHAEIVDSLDEQQFLHGLMLTLSLE